MSCKPSNYGYNRHNHAGLPPSIRSRNLEREFSFAVRNFGTELYPPRKYSFSTDVISSKAFQFSFLWDDTATPIFPLRLHSAFRSAKIVLLQRANPAPLLQTTRIVIDPCVHLRGNRSRHGRRASDRSYRTKKSLAARPRAPGGVCERLKTPRRAIRYPRNYVYPSPLVWNDSHDDGTSGVSLQDCSLVDEIINSVCV